MLDFNGDTQASGVKALSQEVTALLELKKVPSEVVIKITSPGGTVTGYGLASAEMKVRCTLYYILGRFGVERSKEERRLSRRQFRHARPAPRAESHAGGGEHSGW